MPKSLGELLNDIFTKTNVKVDSPEITAILQNETIFKAPLPDGVTELVQSSLYTEGAARSKWYDAWRRETLNGVDAHIERFAKEDLKMDDAFMATLKKEINSGKKVEMIIGETKKQTFDPSKSPEDVKALQTKVNELQKSLSDKDLEYKSGMDKVKADSSLEVDTELTDIYFRQALSSYGPQLIFDKDLDIDTKVDAIAPCVRAAIAKNNLKLVRDGKKVKLVKQDGTDFYDASNKLVDFKALVDPELARNKFLRTVADPDNSGVGGGNPAIISGGGKIDATTTKLISELDVQIAANMK